MKKIISRFVILGCLSLGFAYLSLIGLANNVQADTVCGTICVDGNQKCFQTLLYGQCVITRCVPVRRCGPGVP